MVLALLIVLLVLSLGWGAYGWPTYGYGMSFGPFGLILFILIILLLAGAVHP